ncbi:hypothetical protein GGF32_006772 [Allomyces javanicus]|nr:hypothetical protein GGF32_006772 [Allomyces javanicus]
MKLQALFVLAAAAAFVAADAYPFAPERAASEDAFIDDVGFSTMAAPAPIAQHPHLAVAAALKKPTKPGQRRRRTPKKPLTPEQKRKRQAKMRARRARRVKAGKNAAGRVATTVKGGKPIRTRSTMTGVKRPRIHGKPGGMTRKPKAGARKPQVSLATRLQKKINSLPVGSPLRVMYERRLARIKKPKNTALMSIAETPNEFGSPYGLVPFADPPFPTWVEYAPGAASKIVRNGLTQGSSIQHKYGFRTTQPLEVPDGTKYATVQLMFIVQAETPIRAAQPIPPLCTMRQMVLTVFHGNKPLGGKTFDQGSYGSSSYQRLDLVVPVSQLSPSPAPITMQVAQEHASPTPCMDRSYAQFRGLKVAFHDTLPVKEQGPAANPRSGQGRVSLAGRRYSVSDSGYDYEAFDDMWDDAYDGGDFSDAYDEDAVADDEYDGGDFSVSEDAAYDGDDMWEDMYDVDEGFSVEDAYDEDAAVDEEYYGSDFSVSEDAAYEGDDMWEDSYDGEGFSVEDAYDEDAAADDED